MRRKFLLHMLLTPIAGGAASGCADIQGLHYERVSVRALHEDATAVAEFPAQACTTLPMLLGSRVVDRWSLGEDITVVVDARRDSVGISLEGATREESLSLSAEAIEAGVQRSLSVQDGASGARYVVVVSSGCPKPEKP